MFGSGGNLRAIFFNLLTLQMGMRAQRVAVGCPWSRRGWLSPTIISSNLSNMPNGWTPRKRPRTAPTFKGSLTVSGLSPPLPSPPHPALPCLTPASAVQGMRSKAPSPSFSSSSLPKGHDGEGQQSLIRGVPKWIVFDLPLFSVSFSQILTSRKKPKTLTIFDESPYSIY